VVDTTLDLLRSSGQPRPRATRRTDAVMAALSVWTTLGLFLDAYAHANLPGLETFFTPWHAVFYTGFAATTGWVLWTVWCQVRSGRRGLAAVPVGYGSTLLAIPAFAVSGGADMLWHIVFGVETTTDIFFSPSHLGLITSGLVIFTSPLRSAWADPSAATPGLPAVLTLALAGAVVLLFLTYGNALLFAPDAIVGSFSTLDGGSAEDLAVHVAVTNLVLLAPLLLLARRWPLPFGAATLGYAAAASISATLTGFEHLHVPLAILAAGFGVDLVARWLRPSADRRGAYWMFAATAALLTWTVYLGVASVAVGQLPAIPELWTGVPVVAALLGWLLAVLMLPHAEPIP
jgi:hypothetical protein